MNPTQRNEINAIIADLELIQVEAVKFSKPSYSQGRAMPPVATRLLDTIGNLKALLVEDELEVTHTTTLVSANEVTGKVQSQLVAEMRRSGQSPAKTK